jgi:hypothetical protein
MSTLASFPFEIIADRGNIREADVGELRQALYDDGVISPEEAERLIALDGACPVQAAAWSEVYLEALTDFIVHQTEPRGYITQENAEWLICRLAPEGVIGSRKTLDLLVHILDAARLSPPRLIAFAIAQIRDAVISGDDQGRSSDEPATISDEDVELIRRLIYAFGGDGNIAVTRAEAEVLCDINDSLDPESPNEAWTELYIKAMANFLLANSGYAVPAREEALKSDCWLDSRGELSPLDLAGSIARLSLQDIMGAYRKQSREEGSLSRLDRQYRELLTGEVLTADEANWLIARLTRDGQLTPAEVALISYLKENAVEIDPRFKQFLDREQSAA